MNANDTGPVFATDKTGASDDVRAYLAANKSFPLATFISDVAADLIRSTRNKGGYVLECAFEREHTAVGGEGCWCDDPLKGTPAVINCSHAHCASRKTVHFLAEYITSGRISWKPLMKAVQQEFERTTETSYISRRASDIPPAKTDWLWKI